MNNKKVLIVLLALLMIVAMAACADNTTPTPDVSGPAPEGSVTQEPQEPENEPAAGEIVIVDHAGREVTLPAPAEKIVSGYYISSSMCIALGLTDKLVGIEAKAESRPIYALAAPQLIDLPNVGSAKEFDLEGCIALEPDLVILPQRLIDSANTMEDLGIPVLLVSPESQERLVETIEMIAVATGTEERAQALITYYNEQITEAAGLIANLSDAEKPLVYMAGNSAYLSTAPKDMYQASLITSAGGRNAAVEIEGDNWLDISYEQLLDMDPDVIIMAAEASYTADDIKNDSQLAQLKAVQNGAIYSMPDAFEAWDSPVPSCTLGLKWILSVLHEDLYPFETMQQEAVIFYRTFYGVEIDPAMVTK